MPYPKYDDLMKNDSTSFTAVLVAARRARQLLDGAEAKVESEPFSSPLTVAVDELRSGAFEYTETEAEIVERNPNERPKEAIGVILDDDDQPV